MLSEKEKQFMVRWEKVREKERTVSEKIRNGLPMAVIFSLPILLFIFSVRIFLPDWYTKISNTGSGTFVAIIIALLLCILFFAYFRMQYKWEMNEQLYTELKNKENRDTFKDISTTN